jgi:hypothetical protein
MRVVCLAPAKEALDDYSGLYDATSICDICTAKARYIIPKKLSLL